jgi:hypothetical protein
VPGHDDRVVEVLVELDDLLLAVVRARAARRRSVVVSVAVGEGGEPEPRRADTGSVHPMIVLGGDQGNAERLESTRR